MFLQRQFPTHAPLGVDELQIQTIASRALDRCAAAASTWTCHTVQEQVTRIVTEYGARANPADLRELVDMATDLAVGDCLSVLPPGSVQPEHVAHLTSLQVIAVETKLRDLLTAATEHNGQGDEPDVKTLAAERGLDDAQAQAAAATASTDPLVMVEGAAGAGKTTMLGVAIAAATAEGRVTRIVTPTKKAANVAAQELGVSAESVAKLLHAHGWRWNDDGVWSRVDPGDRPAWAKLSHGERIVVDEAGLLDQDSAIALLTTAAEVGATIALVGDRAQLPAVGRGGVLDIAAALVTGSGCTVHDLDTVHRFTDPAYADLTLKLREGHDPSSLFDRLHGLSLVQLHATEDSAHEEIADASTAAIEAGTTVAATVATNDEARDLNERVRSQRVAAGEVDDTTTVTGCDGLPVGVGDVIATRRNDSGLGVANRQVWTVQHVGNDGTLSVIDAGNARHRRSVTLPPSYVAEHAHLAYAATGYGVQGVTTTTAHTLLSGSLAAAGVYVGMTRGRDSNVLHAVADDLDDARRQFIEALERDRADRGLEAATSDAHAAVAGLAAEGPVKVVNNERARLVQAIAHADQEAERWEHAAGLLAAQARTHAHEEASGRNALAVAEAHSAAVFDDAVRPLLAQAIVDGRAYLDAHYQQVAAREEANSTGRLTRRSAKRRLGAARAEAQDARARVLDQWNSLPATGPWAANTRDGLDAWAERVAYERAHAAPSVATARQQVEVAGEVLKQTRWRHRAETEELTIGVYGRRDAASLRTISGAHSAEARVQRWQQYADASRADLAHIESLPIGRAVRFIETRNAQAPRAGVGRTAAGRNARLDLRTEHRIEQAHPELGRSM